MLPVTTLSSLCHVVLFSEYKCVCAYSDIDFSSVPMFSVVRLASGSPRSAGVLLTVTVT